LCDELKSKVKPFLHRVQFESVDISQKVNVRWLRLYRYEIPVVFLNGEYLCKHALDELLLEQRLKAIENR
ncbi:DUF836 domain containing protein, partial [Asbolus verrucosus]